MTEEYLENTEPFDEGQAELRARAMRDSLDQFELDDEDLALLNGDFENSDSQDSEFGLPVLAVIGRPNVGKSTLVKTPPVLRETAYLILPIGQAVTSLLSILAAGKSMSRELTVRSQNRQKSRLIWQMPCCS